MTKIVLKTSGIRLTGRLRDPDIDHATQIWNLVKRKYTVNASDPLSMWSVSFLRYPDHAFVNQPDGTTEVLRMSAHYGTEDARLVDDALPTWIVKLGALINLARPDGWHISSNLGIPTPTGDTNG